MLEIAALVVGEPSTTGPINPFLTGFRTCAYLGSLSPFNLEFLLVCPRSAHEQPLTDAAVVRITGMVLTRRTNTPITQHVVFKHTPYRTTPLFVKRDVLTYPIRLGRYSLWRLTRRQLHLQRSAIR